MRALLQKHPLLRFLAGHLAVGVIAGWTVLALLLGFDALGLATLLWASPDWPLLLAMLAFGFAITFGSLAMGTGVMSLGWHHRPGDGSGPLRHNGEQPVPALARRSRRRS